MQNRSPAGQRRDGESGNERQGNTVPAQGETQNQVPRVPHDRDESADSQAAQEPSGQRIGKQGEADVERGLVDTDKGPALDQAYGKVRGVPPGRG